MTSNERSLLGPNAEKLLSFIIERHNIALKREAGQQKPWTSDPILQQYRFCNIYRELDSVTKWISQNWREPHNDDRHLWFAITVARYINLPYTLKALGYPVPWDPNKFRSTMLSRRERGIKLFNAAYIISTQGQAKDKVEYLINFLNNLWASRANLIPLDTYTLFEYNAKLIAMPGIGNFMSGQIIADLKYVGPLRKASDWHTFAVSGPGSRRGLNRVMGNPVKQVWKEYEWYASLLKLRNYVNRNLPSGWEKLHAQDVQNCCCEFDKICRVVYGEGRPKQKYPGTR